jgi:hypothetical protein
MQINHPSRPREQIESPRRTKAAKETQQPPTVQQPPKDQKTKTLEDPKARRQGIPWRCPDRPYHPPATHSQVYHAHVWQRPAFGADANAVGSTSVNVPLYRLLSHPPLWDAMSHYDPHRCQRLVRPAWTLVEPAPFLLWNPCRGCWKKGDGRGNNPDPFFFFFLLSPLGPWPFGHASWCEVSVGL